MIMSVFLSLALYYAVVWNFYSMVNFVIGRVDLESNIETVYEDYERYVNNTVNEMDHLLLGNNIDELEAEINSTLLKIWRSQFLYLTELE